MDGGQSRAAPRAACQGGAAIRRLCCPQCQPCCALFPISLPTASPWPPQPQRKPCSAALSARSLASFTPPANFWRGAREMQGNGEIWGSATAGAQAQAQSSPPAALRCSARAVPTAAAAVQAAAAAPSAASRMAAAAKPATSNGQCLSSAQQQQQRPLPALEAALACGGAHLGGASWWRHPARRLRAVPTQRQPASAIAGRTMDDGACAVHGRGMAGAAKYVTWRGMSWAAQCSAQHGMARHGMALAAPCVAAMHGQHHAWRGRAAHSNCWHGEA